MLASIYSIFLFLVQRGILITLIFSYTPLVNGNTYSKSHNSDKNCYYDNFYHFFGDFSESIDIQKISISLPLEFSYIDTTTDLEPVTIKEQQGYNTIDYPIIEPSNTRVKNGSVITIYEYRDVIKVKLNHSDSGVLIYYYFHQKPCWKLYKKEDSSF